MSDLWTEASRDIEAEASDRRLVTARLEAAPLLPFLTAAQSLADFDQRVALAEERLIHAVGGDQMLAAQVVAQVRSEMVYPEPVTKRSFRIEADTAGGGYYVVDEQTGQDVGSYPDQAAAEQAASSNPELEVSHTPTGNPATPGLTQGGPDAAPSSDGTPGGDEGAPAAMAPDSAEGMTPAGAPSGSGDAGSDGEDSDSDDQQFPQSKSASFNGFKIALQEGEDPLFPLLQLLEQGQGQPEEPSYHTDSQADLGAPQGHANGEIGTSNPEGDFMSAPDAKRPYAASKTVDNPYAPGTRANPGADAGLR